MPVPPSSSASWRSARPSGSDPVLRSPRLLPDATRPPRGADRAILRLSCRTAATARLAKPSSGSAATSASSSDGRSRPASASMLSSTGRRGGGTGGGTGTGGMDGSGALGTGGTTEDAAVAGSALVSVGTCRGLGARRRGGTSGNEASGDAISPNRVACRSSAMPRRAAMPPVCPSGVPMGTAAVGRQHHAAISVRGTVEMMQLSPGTPKAARRSGGPAKLPGRQGPGRA